MRFGTLKFSSSCSSSSSSSIEALFDYEEERDLVAAPLRCVHWCLSVVVSNRYCKTGFSLQPRLISLMLSAQKHQPEPPILA